MKLSEPINRLWHPIWFLALSLLLILIILPLVRQGMFLDGVNDGATRDLLSGFIIHVLGEVENARGMEHREGTTELTLKSLLTSLPLIYHDLEHRPLLDIPDDSTPLNQFQST